MRRVVEKIGEIGIQRPRGPWHRSCSSSNDMANLVPPEQARARVDRDKAIRILARSIYRELRQNGYASTDVVALSSELLNQLTSDLKPSP